jgi:predicted nuclease of predicted toxin-antitoxin system
MTQMGQAGRYDNLTDRVLGETDADGVILVVLGGNKGSGFTLSCKAEVTERLHDALPSMLRQIADTIESGAQPTGVRVTQRGGSSSS